MHANYFEGVLQLRNPNEKVFDFIEQEMDKKPEVFISKQKKEGDGVDLYMSSQKFLQNLGKGLQQKFGGELKVSVRIYTKSRQTSKEVYRVTVMFRVPKFRRGDIVRIRGRQYKVTKMGKKINAQEVETGKKITASYSDVQ